MTETTYVELSKLTDELVGKNICIYGRILNVRKSMLVKKCLIH